MTDVTSTSQVQGHVVPPGMAQVLTHNAIPKLTHDLDASDVLECYALVRSAPLHGIANATIHIQKTAIGIRYRPTGAAALVHQQLHSEKRPMEITLEYGPQRFGPSLTHEAVPYIQVSEQESSFIGWENEGKVFYTTKIVTESYLSSYYMASMTGAVLNKILVQAVEYAERRRRYQPFTVYSVETGRDVRSSSSVDFAQYIWKQLANLGVEIHPILPPPIYEARLWVDSWEKVIPEPSMANEAAAFYQNLYQCLESIATNDYSAYQPTPQPTTSHQPTVVPSISPEPTEGASSLTYEPSSTSINPDFDATSTSITNPPTPSVTGYSTNGSEPEDGSDRQNFRARRLDDENFDDEDFLDDSDDTVFGSNDDDEKNDFNIADKDTDKIGPLWEIDERGITLPPHTLVPTSVVQENISSEKGVEKVKQAAAEAQQAANEAKNAAQTEGENKAADAAQAAATAAQAVADATSNVAGHAAMEGLLSGDGMTMASIVTRCFTDQQYDIASVDENGTVSIHAFLYHDGSTYYKLNLTSPYLEIAKVNRALPKAVNSSEFGSGGEFIDFVLAILVLCCVFLLFIAILQRMGYRYFESFYRCQRWFFNPSKFDYEGDTLDDDENPFNFGEDGIPLSMGGRLSQESPIALRTLATRKDETQHFSELRMPDLHQSNRVQGTPGSRSKGFVRRELEMSSLTRRRSVLSDSESQGSLSDDDSAVVPDRLMRDPDLVDMPYLKSTSKVAIPVGSSSQSNNGSSHRRNYDVEYEEKEFSF